MTLAQRLHLAGPPGPTRAERRQQAQAAVPAPARADQGAPTLRLHVGRVVVDGPFGAASGSGSGGAAALAHSVASRLGDVLAIGMRHELPSPAALAAIGRRGESAVHGLAGALLPHLQRGAAALARADEA